MDINKIIFESMLSEAISQVENRCIKGAEIEEAIQATIEELHLSFDERAALAERAKKASTLVHEAPAEDLLVADPEVDEPTSAATASGNAMHFGSEDDLDAAAGMLMYKGCPWKTKCKDGGQLLIEFDDVDTLQEAMDILKRKFDFVEHGQRRVGVVEFDNLADYGKVMEFMKKHGMMIECREMGPLYEYKEFQ